MNKSDQAWCKGQFNEDAKQKDESIQVFDDVTEQII